METSFNPIINLTNFVVFTSKTVTETDVINGVTVNMFRLVCTLNKATTNWTDAKTKKDIKCKVTLKEKSLRIILFKIAINFGFRKNKTV